jgi:hypothetical protein
MLSVKIQFHNFEAGEFKKIENLHHEQLLDIVNHFDFFKELMLKGGDDIVPNVIISKEQDIVKILPVSEDLLDLLYFPAGKKEYYKKRASKAEILDTLSWYICNIDSELKSKCYKMNTSDYNNQISLMAEKEFIYKFSLFRGTTLLIMLMLLSLLFYVMPSRRLEFFLSLPFAIALLPPYLQYVRKSIILKIDISRGRDIFEVETRKGSYQFTKKDILSIIYYYRSRNGNSLRQGTLADYAYMIIQFKDGRNLFLNTMTIEKHDLEKKFREQKITKHDVAIPYIRKNVLLQNLIK